MTESRQAGVFFAGVDIGSSATKCAVVNAAGTFVSSAIVPTGARALTATQHALAETLGRVGVARDQVALVIATGYGRKRAEADGQVTEITCHARGAIHLFPGTRTILDIGGQDTKAIRVTDSGDVHNFVMNDKCAAGTGRFLEVMARALELDLDDMGPMSLRSVAPQRISSFCTVFGESEVVSHLADGVEVQDIALGLHEAIGHRVVGMLRRVGIESEVTMSGGVSRNVGMRRTIEKIIGCEMNVSGQSQVMGALGAALIARDKWQGRSEAANVQ
jgi:predicted CoA-substrate-specific enzyme activase